MNTGKEIIGVVLFTLVYLVTAAVELTVKPDSIKIGFTRSFELKCSASPSKSANLTNLISLNLLHSETSETADFTTLSTIDVFDGIKVFQHDTADGYINSDEESHLSMNWTFPSKEDSGWYRCEVHGVNSIGHPVHFSTTVRVVAEKPDFDSMIEELRRIKAEAANFFKCGCGGIETRFEKAKVSFFEISPVFNGFRYLMSKTSNTVVSSHARATCELFGAHLADINDYDEWYFVKTFSINLGDVRIVMIDGTDEGHEKQWVSTHTGNNLTYFNWQSGYPVVATTSNCLYMYRDAGWQMQGNICTFDASGYMPRYLCKFKEI